MKVYQYLFDNNKKSFEGRHVICVLSFEKFTFEEFQEIVNEAYEKCKVFNDYYDVANLLVATDDRFFFPESVHVAYIGTDGSDNTNKVRRFYSCME